MHEFETVKGIVNNVLPYLHARGVKHIEQIHFHNGGAF